MKKYLTGLCLILTTTLFATQKDIHITTPGTSLLLSAPENGELQFIYYGSRITDSQIAEIHNTGTAVNLPAYPVFGIECTAEAALQVQHADGNLSLDMTVTGITTHNEPNATHTRITMRDKIYPFHITVHYKAWQNADIIETWTEITHNEKKPVRLQQFASAHLPIRKNNVWITHLYGAWANESKVIHEPLQPGIKTIKNKDGVRNSHTSHAEVMISLSGQPNEQTGPVIGAALCWGGNFRLTFDTNETNHHSFFAGINEDASQYNLRPGETFTTPELALTYTNNGLGGASRNFHQWARNQKIHAANKQRDILLNSWEGVYFDITQQNIQQMIKDIAGMGGELFVMDDGWFGGKYQRNSDNTSLGDWQTDIRKLPGGIDTLIQTAQQQGIKFGIWLEPEMTNTVSELYEKHPDWIICQPNRQPRPGRGGTQLVLDLSNPKVQDYIYNTIDNLMTVHPQIAYIKWDANMNIANYGSSHLPAANQSHLYIDYHRGLRNIMQRIRNKYPDLVIQACASGGGRANYGILPHFDEFWVSDNTEALQRIYMQWGISYFFPAVAMASHVGSSPNHQTGRPQPLKFRFDVAMTGRLGMEMQPAHMTEKEKQFATKAIQTYKQIRPVIQQGDLYRLISPYDNQGAASLIYCTPGKEEAVFFAFKTLHYHGQTLPRFQMQGLDSEKQYIITELNTEEGAEPLPFEGKTISGATLINQGIELPLKNEYASHVLHIKETN